MTARAAVLFCLLAAACPAAGPLASPTAQSAEAVGLQLRLMEGGFCRAKGGKWYPCASLRFYYAGGAPKFHRPLTVELVEAAGLKRVASWNTFVSLKPGKSLTRSYGRESLARWDSPASAPALALRVRLPGGGISSLLPLPAAELPAKAKP